MATNEPDSLIVERTVLKALMVGLDEADCAALTKVQAQEVFHRLTVIARKLQEVLETN